MQSGFEEFILYQQFISVWNRRENFIFIPKRQSYESTGSFIALIDTHTYEYLELIMIRSHWSPFIALLHGEFARLLLPLFVARQAAYSCSDSLPYFLLASSNLFFGLGKPSKLVIQRAAAFSPFLLLLLTDQESPEGL